MSASHPSYHEDSKIQRIPTIIGKFKPDINQVYDLCCDHGQIGLAAALKGHQVTFNDREPVIIERLRRGIEIDHPSLIKLCRFHVGDARRIPFRSPCQIIAAGVGNHLIADICQSIQDKAGIRLILGIQKRSVELRIKLDTLGWRMVDENLCLEQGRFREVVVLESQGKPLAPIGAFECDSLESRYQFFTQLEQHLEVVRNIPPNILSLCRERRQECQPSDMV
ncbi:tRNA (adenine(22)-N(1))-methyltransferase TrmK [Pseudobacteriovorax antillogorgiicola]|uniref:tRNA A22 N-methylase n=1 Tax=Pseudobacteriovorax antillogorgiicola TaxID=1513793 RepID=A0A1Y6CDU1_9BACT|nr:tRNA (adenine(22)-N(1))-methyltransferase TrmK [Pseudobacteriovorax antillogorgiicola]TCS48353.1 tRNA A22 N-methylase [Pseudobacteriovorax antillogorgiicola]SMF56261.1 tRNA A22 N-methylase [Pseudobacteriovorax antillogorgiicola]